MISIRPVVGGYAVRLSIDIPPVFVPTRAAAIVVIEQMWELALSN